MSWRLDRFGTPRFTKRGDYECSRTRANVELLNNALMYVEAEEDVRALDEMLELVHGLKKPEYSKVVQAIDAVLGKRKSYE